MAITVISVPVGHSARPDAAFSMRRAQRRAGTTRTINSSYRSFAEQLALFNDNYTRSYKYSAKRDPKWFAGNLYWRRLGDTVSVAVPGKSKHNYGLAFDVQPTSGLQGLLLNRGSQHGFKRTIMPSEPWHWEYVPANDKWRSNIILFQKSLHTTVSNGWGGTLDKAALALRNAAYYGNYGDTDAEQKDLQARVGVTPDGDIGPKTKSAVKYRVKQLQGYMHNLGLYYGKVDGNWGSGTENAFRSFRRIGHE